MHKLLKVYRLLNILSIDVALGAVCCAAWFARVFDVQLRAYALMALGLSVWIIYTADHLLDARKIKQEASTARHRFHQKWFVVLLGLLIAAVVIDGVLLFFIRAKIIYAGFVLAGIVVLYLLVNRSVRLMKELMVGVMYCTGVLLPTLAIRGFVVEPSQRVLIVSFLLTCLVNLVLFSWYDVDRDRADGNLSLALSVGKRRTQQILTFAFLVQAVLLVFVFWQMPFQHGTLLLAMNAVLFLLFLRPTCFVERDKFRLLGDVIFLFPAVLVLVG